MPAHSAGAGACQPGRPVHPACNPALQALHRAWLPTRSCWVSRWCARACAWRPGLRAGARRWQGSTRCTRGCSASPCSSPRWTPSSRSGCSGGLGLRVGWGGGRRALHGDAQGPLPCGRPGHLVRVRKEATSVPCGPCSTAPIPSLMPCPLSHMPQGGAAAAGHGPGPVCGQLGGQPGAGAVCLPHAAHADRGARHAGGRPARLPGRWCARVPAVGLGAARGRGLGPALVSQRQGAATAGWPACTRLLRAARPTAPLRLAPPLPGWACFRGLTPSCGSDCSGAPLLPVLYVLLNLAFNVSGGWGMGQRLQGLVYGMVGHQGEHGRRCAAAASRRRVARQAGDLAPPAQPPCLLPLLQRWS